MKIRPCTPADLPELRKICLATSSIPVKTKAQRTFLYTMYCDYYLEQEAEHCFTAVEESGRPVGYILCAPSYERYRRIFKRSYVKRVLQASPVRVFEAFGEILIQKPFAAQYPAHLHIDIIEEYQRQGLGHQLMGALTAHLRALDVPGVMLGVGASNEKALSFYNKTGFTKLRSAPGSVLLGLRLGEPQGKK